MDHSLAERIRRLRDRGDERNLPGSRESVILQRAQYRAFLERISEPDDVKSVVANNFDNYCAAVAIEVLTKKARRKIEILTGSLNKNVYGGEQVVNVFRDFLRNKFSVVNLMHDLPQLDADCELTKFLRSGDFNGQVNIERVSELLVPDIRFHFFVVDEKHYRYEQNKNYFEGTVRFNDPETAGLFSLIFKDISERSRSERNGGDSRS